MYTSSTTPVLLMINTIGFLVTMLFGLRQNKAEVEVVSLELSSEETLDSRRRMLEDQRLSSYSLSPSSTRTMPNTWRPEDPASSR